MQRSLVEGTPQNFNLAQSRTDIPDRLLTSSDMKEDHIIVLKRRIAVKIPTPYQTRQP